MGSEEVGFPWALSAMTCSNSLAAMLRCTEESLCMAHHLQDSFCPFLPHGTDHVFATLGSAGRRKNKKTPNTPRPLPLKHSLLSIKSYPSVF